MISGWLNYGTAVNFVHFVFDWLLLEIVAFLPILFVYFNSFCLKVVYLYLWEIIINMPDCYKTFCAIWQIEWIFITVPQWNNFFNISYTVLLMNLSICAYWPLHAFTYLEMKLLLSVHTAVLVCACPFWILWLKSYLCVENTVFGIDLLFYW